MCGTRVMGSNPSYAIFVQSKTTTMAVVKNIFRSMLFRLCLFQAPLKMEKSVLLTFLKDLFNNTLLRDRERRSMHVYQRDTNQGLLDHEASTLPLCWKLLLNVDE